MHVFKYSPRKGTKAAEMKGQVDGTKKEERSKKLIELSNENEKEYNKQCVGKKLKVLFEEKKNGIYKGHTKNYIQVYLKEENVKENQTEKDIENKIIEVLCYETKSQYVISKM